MKNDAKTILSIMAVIIISIILAIITVIQYKEKIVEEELDEFGKSTYTFVGDSEHFSFNTGKVFFKSEEYESIYNKKILISDFEQTSIIDGLISESIKVSFGNKVWKTSVKKIGLNKINQIIDDYYFYEEELNKQVGKKKQASNLDIINKENFKSALKVEIEYCTIEDECETEVFAIDYKD